MLLHIVTESKILTEIFIGVSVMALIYHHDILLLLTVQELIFILIFWPVFQSTAIHLYIISPKTSNLKSLFHKFVCLSLAMTNDLIFLLRHHPDLFNLVFCRISHCGLWIGFDCSTTLDEWHACKCYSTVAFTSCLTKESQDHKKILILGRLS